MSSPVADGSFLYGFGSKRKGQLFCLDAKTGAAKWTTEGRGGTNAAIQSAGPHLIVLTNDGDLLVLNRNPEKYDEVRRYRRILKPGRIRSCWVRRSSFATPTPFWSGR